MRCRHVLLAAVVALAAAGGAGAQAASGSGALGITVVIDGALQQYDVPPMMVSGRVMVPMRGIFEAHGVEVMWHGAMRMVTAKRGATDISLSVGEQWAMVNQTGVQLDAPVRMHKSRVFVPLRFVSEALGSKVTWYAETRQVIIQRGLVSTPTTEPVPAGMIRGPVAKQKVAVGLQEYSIALTPNRVQAGEIQFDVLNKGITSHALAIEGMEARTPNLGRGHKAELTVTLQAGTYTLYCPIGTHRQAGMETKLIVE